MSKVQQLIEKLCPEGVEYKPLKDVCDFNRGKRVTKKDLTPTGYPVVSGGKGYMGYIDKYNREANTITIAQYGVAGFVKLQTEQFWANDVCFSVYPKSDILNKYLYYCLVNKQAYLYEIANTKAIPASISLDGILTVTIPIPPIPVQEEIVKILDKFTTITDELTETLQKGIELSQKQYKYYRDLLFSETKLSKDGFEWKTLDKVGELIRGNGLTKSDFTDVGVPAIHYGQIYTYYGTSTTKTKSFVSTALATKLKKVEAGDVVITNTSENVKDVGKSLLYLGEKTAVTGGHATIFKPDKSLIAGKYFVYYTQSIQFSKEKQKYARGTKVIDVSAKDMAKIVIPIPSLKIQNEIVAILDNLESVNKKLTAKLQKAIELSQKQYEYYRNQLLTFEPLE